MLILLRDHPELQILLLIMLSVAFQTLLIAVRPYSNPGDQRMALFNEFAASFYLYIMMLLTDFWGENTLRDKVGWGLLVFLSVVVLVNLTKVFWAFFSWVSRKVKKHVVPKVQTLVKKEQPTVAIKTEIDIERTSNNISRSAFSLDMLQPFEKHLVNNSDYSTISYTNVGRMGRVIDEGLNLDSLLRRPLNLSGLNR